MAEGSLRAKLSRPFSQIRSKWQRSLQFRTVVSTLLLCSIAFLGIGAYLSHQIASALYEERIRQYEAEASSALKQMDGVFANSTANDRASTEQQVSDALNMLQRSGSDQRREFILAPYPASNVWVQARTSSGVTPGAIPRSLSDAVRSGNAQYYEAISLEEDGRVIPAVAFGQKVKLPPNNDYAVYLVYSMDSIQRTLDVIHGVLWGAGLLMLGVVGGIAWIVTKSVVGPISQAASVSERLAAGNLEERIQVRGKDEIARLGVSFNDMASKLQLQINELGNLSRMQQRFVSDVSHELRTPLTTVRMAAEILYEARDSFDAMNQRSAELLFNQVERFEILLADLLEISRHDAGAAVLDLEPTNINALVQQVVDSARPVIEQSGCQVSVVSSAKDPMVEADSRRIERILRNFLINALEHSEGNPIEIYVADASQSIAVAVRDHGIGMSESESERVFDRFWRADPARARTMGGSGLGLSIASEDARLHGGWLSAWGRPGDGSAFIVVMPRHPDVEVLESPLPLPPESKFVLKRPEESSFEVVSKPNEEAESR